jgi:hypothetical protein
MPLSRAGPVRKNQQHTKLFGSGIEGRRRDATLTEIERGALGGHSLPFFVPFLFFVVLRPFVSLVPGPS